MALEQGFMATPLHRALGVSIEQCNGGVVFRGTIGNDFARADGLTALHGGAIATLLDSATTFAAIAETGRLWATVDLRVDYLRPARLGEVEVIGTVVRAGSNIARTRAELRDSSGKVAAVAIATLAADPSTTAPRSSAGDAT